MGLVWTPWAGPGLGSHYGLMSPCSMAVFKGSRGRQETAGFWFHVFNGLILVWKRLASLWKRILLLSMKPANGISAYRWLLAWGRRSRVPRLVDETPLEYKERLSTRFPNARIEIVTIVNTFNFNKETYGNKTSSPTERSLALGAAWRLRSPRHWPARIRSWSP